MNLGEISKGRNNNLDMIRFIAASLVILCHAYPISLGEGFVDILGQFSHGQMHFGNFAVCIFFLYGGFLISKSAERIQKGTTYFKMRLSRILPCLIAVTFMLALIVGPIVSSLPIGEYFTNTATYKYLLNSIMVLTHDLPGVFEGNIYGSTVNGPLWTLPIEFLCYILCFLFLKLGFLNEKRMKWTVPIFVIGYIGAWMLIHTNSTLVAALRPAGMFYIGMLYYVYRDKISIKKWIAWIALIVMLLSMYFGGLEAVVFLTLPYFLFYVAYGTKLKVSNFSKYGEVSYGMYLCGWPIQQIVCMVSDGTMQPLVNFIITLPLAIICGWLLDRFVEKPGWFLRIVDYKKN